jgi:hypothetical protein
MWRGWGGGLERPSSATSQTTLGVRSWDVHHGVRLTSKSSRGWRTLQHVKTRTHLMYSLFVARRSRLVFAEAVPADELATRHTECGQQDPITCDT